MSEQFFDRNAEPGQTAPKPLSCTNCRQRKIKCNRSAPCLHCHTSRRECVYPCRVRTRRVPHNKELFARISQLEGLVKKIEASSATKNSCEEDTTDDIHAQAPVSINMQHDVDHLGRRFDDQCLAFIKRQETGSHVLGHTFWTRLSQEVGGLRKLLADAADGNDAFGHIGSPSSETRHPPRIIFTEPGIFFQPEQPTEVHRSILARFYSLNVHPLCKILHWPTTRLYLERSTQSTEHPTVAYDGNGLNAVVCAVYFAAVTSMSAVDCQTCLGVEKRDMVARYKRNAEAALFCSDFLNSTEITTLQALVLYIMTLRSHDSSQSCWALVGLAVRIAHALGLHRDGDGRVFSAFDAEMRRRLWWQIIVLDIRACEDRGSEPMILDGSFNTIMPHNLNDDDFDLTSRNLPSPRTGVTEMTFSLICMDVCHTIMKISFIPPFKERRILTFLQKEELVKACTTRIDSIYLAGSSPTDPSVWVVRTIGQILILRLWLVVQYPLHCVDSTSQHFAEGQSLRSAVAYLRLCELMQESDLTTGFSWLFDTYVPWHALAVALAELCSETKGHLVDQAWLIIDRGYDKWSERMADSEGGILWRPIRSLMRKARAARERDQELAPPQSDFSELALVSDNSGSSLDVQNPSIAANDSNSLDAFLNNLGPISPDTYQYSGLDLVASSIPVTYHLQTPTYRDHWNEFLSDVGGAAYGEEYHLGPI